MPAPFKPVVLLFPVLALAACTRSYDRPVVATQPPPPPMLNGALGAPIAPDVPLSGSTTPPGPIAIPGAPVRMSAPEITAAFVNNTAEGVTTNGMPYAMYFTADGSERFKEGNYRDTGTWRVLPDGRFCSSLSEISNGNQECYYMYRTGNAISFERPDGVTVGNVTVVAGDPGAF
jgi:hypothetical protein